MSCAFGAAINGGMLRLFLSAIFGMIASHAVGQTVEQAGPFTIGHTPVYTGPNGVFLRDAGPAGGGGPGGTEMNWVAPSSPTGPSGTNLCDYDASVTANGGYHYLCLSANAAGGGLITYGAAGGAAQLPLNILVNGVPLATGGSSSSSGSLTPVAFTSLTGQTASISTTSLRNNGAVLPVGLYRVDYYFDVTTAGAGSLQETLGWTDDGFSRVSNSASISTATRTATSGSVVVKTDGLTDLTFAMTLSGSGTYSIDTYVTRIR